MPEPTLTNPTYTINGVKKPLTPCTQFVVGQVVTFGGDLPAGASMTPFVRAGNNGRWPGKAWTVTTADVGVIDSIRLNTRKNKKDLPDVIVPVSVVSAASKPTTPPPSKDEDKPTNTPPVRDEPTKPAITPAKYKFGVVMEVIRPDVPVTSKLWAGTKPVRDVLATLYRTYGTGGGSIRIWWNVDFTSPAATANKAPKWDRIREYIEKGGVTEVILCWNAGAQPVPAVDLAKATAKACWDAIPEDLLKYCKGEVGNEIAFKASQDPYWSGTVKQYVTNFLNPFYEVLSPLGMFILCAGLNGMAHKDLKTIVDAGGKFDGVAVHPYAVNANGYKTVINGIAAITKKPIFETEENSKDGPGYKQFLETGEGTDEAEYVKNYNAIEAVRRATPQVVTKNVFNLRQQMRTMTGPLGWFVLNDGDGDNVVDSATATPVFEAMFAAAFVPTLAK